MLTKTFTFSWGKLSEIFITLRQVQGATFKSLVNQMKAWNFHQTPREIRQVTLQLPATVERPNMISELLMRIFRIHGLQEGFVFVKYCRKMTKAFNVTEAEKPFVEKFYPKPDQFGLRKSRLEGKTFLQKFLGILPAKMRFSFTQPRLSLQMSWDESLRGFWSLPTLWHRSLMIQYELLCLCSPVRIAFDIRFG